MESNNIDNANFNFNNVVTKINDKASAITNQQIVVNEDKEKKDVQLAKNIENKDVTVSNEELSAAIEVISAFIKPQIRNVNFTQDESLGKTVVKVFDTQSKELIKQFPSEDVLELSRKIKGLQEEIASKAGMLIDDKV